MAGRTIARIGFGAMRLVAQGDVRHDTSVTVLRQAVEHGINHIDTAQFYGAANALIKAALKPYPDDLLIATKVGARNDPHGGLVAAQRPEQLRDQVEANLTALRVDRIGLVNLRRMDMPPGIIAEARQRVDLDSQLAELIALRDEGAIGAIGLSNVDTAQLQRALPAGIVCVQNAHNPLDRAAEPVLELCRVHSIAWAPFFPLGSARLPGTVPVGAHPVVTAVAQRLHCTSEQAVLAWHLAHYSRTLLIAGTTNPVHLDENIAAGDVTLDIPALEALDAMASTVSTVEYGRSEGHGYSAQ